MIPMVVETFLIKNFQLHSSTDQPPQVQMLIEVLDLQKILLRSSDKNSVQEELEVSLVSKDNLKLWMTTTLDHLTNTSSPKL